MKEKQAAIKKFADESPCICFNLRKATRAITQVYDDMFRQTGLRTTQVAILNSIRMIGSLTISQLSQAMATDRTTITRNLKPLQRDAFIRIQSGQDKREREVRITQKGIDASLQAFSSWEKFQEKVNSSVGVERLEKLCKDLSSTVAQIKKI